MPELTSILHRELREIHVRMGELQKRKEAIENVIRTYNAGNGTEAHAKLLRMPTFSEPLSTLDMAQKVIEKHGEMKAEDIMEAIRQEFGIKPAHTLPQMLYIRARAKRRFYRSPQGMFGLIEKRRKPEKKAA